MQTNELYNLERSSTTSKKNKRSLKHNKKIVKRSNKTKSKATPHKKNNNLNKWKCKYSPDYT